MSLAEPSGDAGRSNAASGFAWAVTLVNLRCPAVVEAFLAHHAQAGAPDDPVAQGVASALQLWQETTGGSKELRRFVNHVAAPRHRDLWQRVVREPLETPPAAGPVSGRPHVAELFRYRP
jgi:hypothetical protein